jgi:hypothetical protein
MHITGISPAYHLPIGAREPRAENPSATTAASLR